MALPKLFMLLVALAVLNNSVKAQHHFNAWLRGTVNYRYGKKISAEAEVQHRRQNGYEHTNPLEQTLMYSFRTRVHYRFSPNFKITASPFAVFNNYKIIQNRGDDSVKPIREYRFATAASTQLSISDKWHFINQTGAEYRIFPHPASDILRLRSKFEWRRNISPTLTVAVYDEVLINATGVTRAHVFDHNRLSSYIMVAISKQWQLDAGYIMIHRLPQNIDQALDEHDCFLNLTFIY